MLMHAFVPMKHHALAACRATSVRLPMDAPVLDEERRCQRCVTALARLQAPQAEPPPEQRSGPWRSVMDVARKVLRSAP